MAKPVGYKSPPERTRWKKGQSGNPTGRKKCQLNLKTDLANELGERIQIMEAGVQRTVTKQRALIKAQLARGIGGDTRAAMLLLQLMSRTLDPPPEAPPAEPLDKHDQALLDNYLARLVKAQGDQS